jgi:hypothetical protein
MPDLEPSDEDSARNRMQEPVPPVRGGPGSHSLTAADFDQVLGLLGTLAEHCERAAKQAATSSPQSVAFHFAEIRHGLQRVQALLHHTVARARPGNEAGWNGSMSGHG